MIRNACQLGLGLVVQLPRNGQTFATRYTLRLSSRDTESGVSYTTIATYDIDRHRHSLESSRQRLARTKDCCGELPPGRPMRNDNVPPFDVSFGREGDDPSQVSKGPIQLVEWRGDSS